MPVYGGNIELRLLGIAFTVIEWKMSVEAVEVHHEPFLRYEPGNQQVEILFSGASILKDSLEALGGTITAVELVNPDGSNYSFSGDVQSCRRVKKRAGGSSYYCLALQLRPFELATETAEAIESEVSLEEFLTSLGGDGADAPPARFDSEGGFSLN